MDTIGNEGITVCNLFVNRSTATWKIQQCNERNTMKYNKKIQYNEKIQFQYNNTVEIMN